MKICVISMTNLFLCPYINKYLSIVGPNNVVDLIYWNRHMVEENCKNYDKVFVYKQILSEKANRFEKVKCFLRFKRYCENILHTNKYDKIIILHNYLAILMKRFLKRKYQGRYLIDIRDYSFERNKLFYILEKKAIEYSGLAVISSEGYRKFLPEWEYIVCHNDVWLSDDLISQVAEVERKADKPIRISFIGMVRFLEQNKKLLDIFGNDERFILGFYGQNAEQLEEYARKRNIKNTIFVGRFSPDETIEFYKKTDVINNYYGNHTPVLDYALSNKLYYAATLKKPILVCKDTFMYEIAFRYSMGITINEASRNAADDFYKMYMDIDNEKKNKGCNAFLKKVREDNVIFEKQLLKFLKRT